ncbi:MAG: MlaD family protein, partial [Pseudomonadota bacterium]|nr:MlaD family protein [Pseudomonadota bacterium]
SNIAGLATLVSGSYIQIEPGDADNAKETHFAGLEAPPAIQSDEAGTQYVLKAEKLGSVSPGTPVYYRDIIVGQVLGYSLGDGFSPITVDVFVRTPFDSFVKSATRFWNASGLTIKMGGGGLHAELLSLQSVLEGGIAFYTPSDMKDAVPAPALSTFQLFESRKTAELDDPRQPVNYVTYFKNTIKDLAPGSPVQIFGIRVGVVTDVKLVLDSQKGDARVRVAFNVQPDKAFGLTNSTGDAAQIARQFVQNGMRVRLEASDLFIGQEVLSLEFVPGAEKAEVATENEALVLPGQAGGMDHLTEAVGDIAGKLNQIPFEEIGAHLNHLMSAADRAFGGPELQQAIHSLAVTLANAEDISKTAKTSLAPALQKLPGISAQLQDAVRQANAFMASVNSGYGDESDFQHNAQRVMNEVNDAARSIRLLADFLERHPEALIKGKSSEGTKP